MNIIDVLARYLLAVPAALLAAVALRYEAHAMLSDSRKRLAAFLTWAAVGFTLYGLSQFFVPAIDMVPARDLNSTLFRALTGFPVQALRAFLAILIMYNMLRATQIVEKERQSQMQAAQAARLDALERIQDELTNGNP